MMSEEERGEESEEKVWEGEEKREGGRQGKVGKGGRGAGREKKRRASERASGEGGRKGEETHLSVTMPRHPAIAVTFMSTSMGVGSLKEGLWLISMM